MVRRVQLTIPILAALAAAAAVLVGGATAAGWAVGRQPVPTPAATIPAPPSSPVEPPYRRYQYMAGVTVTQVTALARSQGFTCQGPRSFGQYLPVWICRRDAGTVHGTITVQARDESRIWEIQAVIGDREQPPAPELALPLLAGLAELPVRSDAGLAAQARSWVQANLGAEATTEFASLRYQARGDVGGDLLKVLAPW
jgi:hypothetical protein